MIIFEHKYLHALAKLAKVEGIELWNMCFKARHLTAELSASALYDYFDKIKYIMHDSFLLWNYLIFFSVNDKVVIQCLQKCRPYLVHLNLRQCFSIHWPAFKAISECRNLQDLNLSECKGVNVNLHIWIIFFKPCVLYYLR